MKDAEVIEAMARAIQQTPSVWINTSQKGIDATYEVCVWTLHSPGDFEVLEAGFRTLYDAEKAIAVWVSRLRSRAAFEVCAPAIRERCAAVAEAYDDGEEYEANGYFIAERIRALPLPTPHDGLTDTSHHAGSSAGEMVLVPREPTEAMLKAGWLVEPGEDRMAKERYAAVLAASRAPPQRCPKCALAKYERSVLFCDHTFHSPAPPHQGGKSE